MKKTLSIILVACFAIALSSCNNKKNNVSLSKYADTANVYANEIANMEANINMDEVNDYLQVLEKTEAKKEVANKVLSAMFEANKDTLFLPFEQTKNDDKVKILSVWVTDMKFDKVMIEARVEALDNSTFMGPHIGLVIKDKQKNLLEVGGGIQGPTDEKLDAGKVYTFTGQIEHLHLLSDFKSVIFNEDIKKW